MLGDFGEPGLIQGHGLEPALNVVVMHHWPGDLEAAAALDDHRQHTVLPTQPLHPVPVPPQALSQSEFIVDEAVSERRIIGMHVDHGIGQVGVVPVSLADRVCPLRIERLLGEPQDLAGPSHRDPLSGQIDHQGIHHFGSVPCTS